MTTAEINRAVSGATRRGAFDLGGLVACLLLVLRTTLPMAALTFVLWGAAYAAYRHNARASDFVDNLEEGIIREQVRRAAELPAPDLAFVGDSSCLFGINPSVLRERFPGRSIENFCTMAWVGPAGYALQIAHMIDSGTVPKKLIIHLHPIQFSRDAGWDAYVEMVRSARNGTQGAVDSSPIAALDYARRHWLGRVLHRPVPAPYSLYYGSGEAMVQGLRRDHGVLVHSSVRQFGTVAAMAKFYRIWTPSPAISFPFATTAAFDNSLEELARVLKNLDRRRVFLLIAPFDAPLLPESLAERDAKMRWIAARLDLPPANVIPSPASMPWYMFVDNAHANRWGSILLSRALADYLPPF